MEHELMLKHLTILQEQIERENLLIKFKYILIQMDGLEQDIQYRDMKIFYNINLILYQNVIKEKDYYSFSRIEIASNLLCGDIILLDKEKAFFYLRQKF